MADGGNEFILQSFSTFTRRDIANDGQYVIMSVVIKGVEANLGIKWAFVQTAMLPLKYYWFTSLLVLIDLL